MSTENGARSMLGRGLSILRCFRPDESELPLTEIARRADMPKPTAHRIISELVREGMLERGEDGLRLGVGLFMLGARVPRQLMLREIAFPYVARLHHLTRGSAFVFLADTSRPDVAMVDAVPPTHGHGTDEMRTALQAAARIFHACGTDDGAPSYPLARMIADDSTRIRQQGYAVVRAAAGTTGVAAPVLTAAGTATAALVVAGPTSQLRPRTAASHLLVACAAISRRAGATRPHLPVARSSVPRRTVTPGGTRRVPSH